MKQESGQMYIFRVIINTNARKRHGYEPEGARAHSPNYAEKYAARFFSEGSVKWNVNKVHYGKRNKDGTRDYEAYTLQNLMERMERDRSYFHTEEGSELWHITYRRYDTLTETWVDEEALVETWPAPPPKRKPSPVRSSPVRMWLRENTTHNVPAKGKLPADLLAIYEQAQKQSVNA